MRMIPNIIYYVIINLYKMYVVILLLLEKIKEQIFHNELNACYKLYDENKEESKFEIRRS